MSEKKTDENIDESRIIIRHGRGTMWFGIISMFIWAAMIVVITIFPNDTAAWWVYAIFIVLFLLCVVITFASLSYEIKVDGNEIHYRSAFGKTKIFNLKSIKSAIEKLHPGYEKQKSLDLYSETELLLTVESSYKGYDKLVSRLQSEGIEFTLTSGVQVSSKDPAKANAKADKKAREKQKDEEEWANFEEQYPEKAKKHRRFCKVLNAVGFLYIFLALLIRLFDIILPITTALFSFGAITLFLIAIFYSVTKNHIINDEMKRNCPKPGVSYALYTPVLFLGLAAMDIYPIVYNFRAWMVFLIVAVIMAAILLFTARERGIKKGTLIWLVVVVCMFSYGASVAVNCELDFSESNISVVHVERKSRGSSRAPSTIIVGFLFDGTEDRIRIPVSRNEFERLEVGDMLFLRTKPGLFGIRWVP